MTHSLTLDDWDSDDDFDYDECGQCQAVVDRDGRCWYCDRPAWIWEGK
jgi:hypothetical protein